MGRNLLDLEVDTKGSPKNLDMMITLDGDDLCILAWNWVDTIKRRKSSGPQARFSIEITDLPDEMKGKILKGHRIDQDHGNPFAGWIEMGKPGELSKEQVEKLKNLSDETLRDDALDVIIDDKAISLDFELPPAAVIFLSTK